MNRMTVAMLLLALPLVAHAADTAKPNIVLILADDLGYSDLGCYGSEIPTPHIDSLATQGLKFTQFYNCARCCPTRASLLTGLYSHSAGVGHMLQNWKTPSYSTGLLPTTATIAERLTQAGYMNYHVGKWHVGGLGKQRPIDPAKNHPLDRGFQHAYGTDGGGSFFAPSVLYRDRERITPGEDFYVTDAFSDAAVDFLKTHAKEQKSPFFLHLCYTAPHFPLQAPAADIAKHRGKYTQGWDALRAARFARQKELGIVSKDAILSPRHPNVTASDQLTAEQRDMWDHRMAIHAAMIDRMDQGVGKVLAELKRIGAANNTLVVFLSDNGASAEALDSWPNPSRGNKPGSIPGSRDSHLCLEVGWANAANTPFREHKMWSHEGGICTPLVARWPAGIAQPGTVTPAVGHVIDFLPTFLDMAGTTPMNTIDDKSLTPVDGISLVPVLRGKAPPSRTLAWEHEGNRAIRIGNYKIVAPYQGPWELYDLSQDRTETKNLADMQTERVAEMSKVWQTWADRVGVLPWKELPGSSYKPTPGYRKNTEPLMK